MTLEDFFTLTEMKDGLASLARVEELISVIQKQKEDVVNNVGDAARQWSSVASNLAATGNEDCLNHFIQLNGLWFLNQWLQKAQRWSNDGNDGSVEELINALLGALERLPVDNEKFTDSGVGITVKQLLGHRNQNVQERARILFDKWNQVRNDDISSQDLEKHGTCCDDEPQDRASISTVREDVCDVSPTEEGAGEGNQVEPTASDSRHLNATRCSDGSPVDSFMDMKISASNQSTPQTTLTSVDANAAPGDMNSLGSSLVSNPCQESLSATEESSVFTATGMASTGTCSSPAARERNVDDRSDVSQIKDTSDGPKEIEVEINKKELSPHNKSTREENFSVSSSSGLSAIPVHAQNSMMEPAVTCHLDSKDGESSLVKTSESHPKSVTVDCGMPKNSRITKELKPIGQAARSLQDLTSNGCILKKRESSEVSFHSQEVSGSAVDTTKGRTNSDSKVSKGLGSSIPSGSSKLSMDTNVMNEIDGSSEMALEYGDIDALEVARQVAIQVEREVVDYREPFCSSSPEGNSEGEIMDSRSPDSIENKHEHVVEALNGNESPSGKDLSDDSSSRKGGNSRISDNIDVDPTDPGQESDSPKLASDAQDSVGRCCFDLNEDVCTEDIDCTMIPASSQSNNLSAPIAVVAASKGTPGLPVTPLHFEGELGWRGSAATSAFRPASPRRTPDGEKTVSGPKQKPNILEIDLNIAEGEDDTAVDPMLEKQIPASSGLPSGDSSLEVSSRRAERLKLDLNRIGDEDVFPTPPSSWRFHHQNGNRSPSPASSSSSRHPFMRDIDLNDNPSFDACGSYANKSSSQETIAYGSFKLDDPVLSIMGSKMSLEKKEPLRQARQSFPVNGLNMESTMGARSSVAYTHIPPQASYGYNGLGMGPAMPFPPALYGPGSVPYMIDSRGATVIPQILGSSTGLDGAPSFRPPFLMSVGSAPSGLNAVGVSRPTLDLNSGIVSVENGNRDVGSLKQLFLQGHGGVMEEQMNSTSQPAGSGMSLKRKEPDSGWEPYPVGYKQVTSWH